MEITATMVIEKSKGDKAVKPEDYDPFEHRDLKNGNSDVRSVANLIKSSLGSGLLAMPLAFSNTGWALGVVSTIVIALVCAHCIQILVEISRECCKIEKKPTLGYAETVESAFLNGPKGARRYASTAKVIADISTALTYFSICSVFTILLGSSIKQLIDRYFPEAQVDVEIYCAVLLIPLAILSQTRNLKWLAPFSLMANILLLGTFIICLYYVFSDGISSEGRVAFNSISRYPAFLSTVIFALEGVGVVMPTENSMKQPQHFLGCPSVLMVAMVVITFMYTTLGLFGYLRYGEKAMGSITLNLPVDDPPAVAGKIFITLAVFLTYPLHFYVGMDIVWKHSQAWFSDGWKNFSHIMLRALVVFACGAVAVALPMLEQILAIVGAMFFSVIGLIIPGVLDIVFFWERGLGCCRWKLGKDIIIVIFGIIAMVSGSAVSILDIIDIINHR